MHKSPKLSLRLSIKRWLLQRFFTPNKGFMKPQDNGEKTFGKDCANKDTKGSGNKDQCSNVSKKKEGKEYKGQNKLSPMDLEKYQKENQCFQCGEQGHSYCNCQKKTQGTPQASHILSNHDDEVLSSSQLLYTWGRVWDQSAVILLDLGSTHNFMSVELAQKLGINIEEMGPPL